MVSRDLPLSSSVRISFSNWNWKILPNTRVWRWWRELLALRWAASLAVGLIGRLVHWAYLSGFSSSGKIVRERVKLVRTVQYMPYLFIASDRHKWRAVCAILGRGYLGSDACSPSFVTRNSCTFGFHFCAGCTRRIRQRLITFPLLLPGSVSCFPSERGSTVCCNEERLPMTSTSWEPQPLFRRATLMRSWLVRRKASVARSAEI